MCRFNLAIERLFISGTEGDRLRHGQLRFNLVIERLFISGAIREKAGILRLVAFQSRHRDAFHFRLPSAYAPQRLSMDSFNLVIERLFISGSTASMLCRQQRLQFQSRHRDAFHFRTGANIPGSHAWYRFNLVIEMLFISGNPHLTGCHQCHRGFNLVIERLFISGLTSCRMRIRRCGSFNLVIERLFISGIRCHP